MDSNAIRIKWPSSWTNSAIPASGIAYVQLDVMVEIAAQLAELNENLRDKK